MARVSSGTLTILVFAVMVGLGGAYVVRQNIETRPALPPVPQAPASNFIVPVAAYEFESGQTVTQNGIAMLQFTPEQFTKSKYAGMPYMRSVTQIEDRVLRTDMKQGEAFLTSNFYPDGSGPGIADRLEEGYRAVTVPIEDVGAVEGFARPGSYVDVLFRSEVTEDRPEVTVTLLERIQVLSVNRNIIAEKSVDVENDGRVTLAVTPMQAKVLKVVEGRGQLSLTLRNPNDELDTMPVDVRDPRLNPNDRLRAMAQAMARNPNVGPAGVMPVQKLQPAATQASTWQYGTDRVLAGSDQVSLDDLLGTPPKPKPVQMEVYRGGQKDVLTFEQPASVAAPGRMINRPTISTPLVGPKPQKKYGRQMQTVSSEDEPVGSTMAGG
ncbi:Flp pilus assembly protein CpaB [Thalassoroseus pseudoceratinae]|uniref:Flp pilus assembly protein CpaB n=1 Tax=Thalassoroseus pseudoceratinae TaxID=2713176 RepID=UPI001423C271|nr:Flp pilus assembly protein CpaB [Thalassoroseus pseudoceratinae]